MRLYSELVLAARSLSRAKGLVAVAILSLALGIGVNGAIFTYGNAIEFRPLPFRRAAELVDISEDNPVELCAGCSVGTSGPTLGAARPFHLLLRHGDIEGALAVEVRAVARTLDPDQPVEDVMPMEDALARWIAPVRFMVTLFGGLGLLAAGLAGFGIYGVLSYVVARRARELGIRMALGADVRHLRRYVVARGLRPALVGLAIGLPAAWLLARALGSLLFTVRPGDPAVFALVAAALTAVVLLACWIPARRATRVNPVDALRFD